MRTLLPTTVLAASVIYLQTKMFEKSLVDLVKGVRNATDTSAYISKSIQDIKDELKNRDVTIKAQALQKLIYVSFLSCREARGGGSASNFCAAVVCVTFAAAGASGRRAGVRFEA